MVALLKRHLVCFYCGSRSAQKQNGSVSCWQCEKCEAVNYLDNEGNIMDPPASSAVPPLRFAHTLHQAPSLPSGDKQEKILFCSTCIKNQQLLTQALAEYLPPFDDPQYPAFEASYDQYRRNLEEQFPQVCARCEPLVRSRINAAGYAAKTDHLRRMIDRTKVSGGVKRTSTVMGWRDVVLAAGAFWWWTSLTGQLLWNASGAFPRAGLDDGLRSEEGVAAPIVLCAWQAWTEKELAQACFTGMSSIAGYSLLLNVASLWWNKCLKQKVHGAQGRMVGLDDYYKLQIVTLLVRLIAWWALQSLDVGLDVQGAVRGAHCFLLLFNILTAVISFRTVKVVSLPPVFTQHSQEELLRPESSNARPGSPFALPSEGEKGSSVVTPRFPISQLGQPREPQQNDLFATDVPIPPPDDDADAMDWTPSQEAFKPNPSRRLSTQTAAPTPSPFHGTLPPAPMSAAQRLRVSNAPIQSSFKKTSPERQQNFFNAITGRSAENEHEKERMPKGKDKGQIELAQPKFFPASDFSADTGLEGLFNAAFSLKDEPHEVTAFRAQQERAQHQQQTTGITTSPQVLGCCFLGVSLLAWKLAGLIPLLSVQLRLSSLTIAIGSSVRTFYQGLQGYRGRTSPTDLGLSGVEFLCTLFLANAVVTYQSHTEMIEIGGTILLGCMLLHGIWMLSSLQTAPPLSVSHIDEAAEQTAAQKPWHAVPQSQNVLGQALEEALNQRHASATPSDTPSSHAIDGYNDSEIGSPVSSSAFSSYENTPVQHNQHHLQQTFSPSPLLSSTTSARYGHYNQNGTLQGNAAPHLVMTRSRALRSQEPEVGPAPGLQGLSGLSISSGASPSKRRLSNEADGGFGLLGRATSPVRRVNLQSQDYHPGFEPDYYSDRAASPTPSIASTVSTAYPVSPYLGARDREASVPAMTPGRMTRSSSRRALGRF
ncbi:hypothetical protein L228DRAFT_280970 [Xylona heveae TC161]|uniref:Ima1 N-terminal domain-containing protein n=1 Tax=Xylona heveae (strain CBS 132557 / TC161) TaxID=1328760 RepID=A0A165J5F5_XYLHT|nr:hypothetical protein L228DRAFT_280970 [Xylona heveae TC161]KZF25754.1 hypothetical protein L228DRAFT_280970 [Xylona heveae TC161]